MPDSQEDLRHFPRLFVDNPVAVNLGMWVLILVGAYKAFTLTREFFPSSDPEQVSISVIYPGATPEEIDTSVALRIEREIKDTDGIDKIETRIFESLCVVIVTLLEGTDKEVALSDLRGALDLARAELPDGVEEPEITLVRPFFPVISVVAHGDVPEERLGEVARQVRDDLLDIDGVSRIAVSGMREREIWAEVLPERLERFSLTFEEVGGALARSNLDFPGGQIKSSRGNIGVRTIGETKDALQLEDLVVSSRGGGGVVRLRDLGKVRARFEDRVEKGSYDGSSAIAMTLFKSPEEDAIEISQAARDYVSRNSTRLGGAVKLETSSDTSRLIRQRIDLMVRNGAWGLLWVALALFIFLDLRVSFWTVVGLPISFLGTFLLMDYFGATINMISLFGLIVVLGLVVDDAIVIGENVYTRMQRGMPAREAAILGTREVARPVIMAVLTTIAAFLPLAFLEGTIGTFLRQLPLVVIAALAISLVEALIILPCHLGHTRSAGREATKSGLWGGMSTVRRRVLEQWLPAKYERVLRFCLNWRYVVLAGLGSASLLVIGAILGGLVPFVLIQDSDAETLMVNVEMTAGTSAERTADVVGMIEKLGSELPEVEAVTAAVGSQFSARGQSTSADAATVGQLSMQLRTSEERQEEGLQTSQEVVAELRQKIGTVAGASRITVASMRGGPGGTDVEVRVRCDDLADLQAAVQYTKEQVGKYDGVADIEDDLKVGKLEARLKLRDSARTLGLTTRDLALQVRHALFGMEVQKLQDGDDEVTVRVVLPEAARRDLAILGSLRIVTPTGGRVPLGEVATLSTDRGYASLMRIDGRRAVTVSADVDETVGNTSQITNDLERRLADIGQRFPGVSVSFEGRRQESSKSLGSLRLGFPLALFLIYSLIAVLFGSYTQPLLVMAAIPFAVMGAIVGHIIVGYPFTLLSMIGGVALAGIVVNDSLILVDFINRNRAAGMELMDAVIAGGRSRLRAILLTSITTIAGLAPLMLERSFQAQFLIPMAVSIVFGLAFATVLTLVVLPVFYAIFEDLRGHPAPVSNPHGLAPRGAG